MTLPPPTPGADSNMPPPGHVLVDIEEGSVDDAYDPTDADVDWSKIIELTDEIADLDQDMFDDVLRFYDRLAD